MFIIMQNLKVVELFAGVGGFRLGLDQAKTMDGSFQTIWANQWEPATKKQHAAEIYAARFGTENFSNEDIEEVIEHNFSAIPDHDVLVGGFPCQDYSVASTLNRSHGLVGKKGVLFWSIYSILKNKGKNAPNFIFLENVDRLLKSPAKQRGKDFAIMLATLSDLGYAIEWRVINAADYGFPQRRRRVYILGYKHGTALYDEVLQTQNRSQWLTSTGVFPSTFTVESNFSSLNEFDIHGSAEELSTNFSIDSPKQSPFETAGVMIGRRVTTAKVNPVYFGQRRTLGEVLLPEDQIPQEFFLKESEIEAWTYLKGAKKEERQARNGHKYNYSEGPVSFPDSQDKPSRTIITSEGGSGPSRFKHVIRTSDGRLRRLVPVELERLNMFPDNHTQLEGVNDSRRAFIMGNALVVGVIEKVGATLLGRSGPRNPDADLKSLAISSEGKLVTSSIVG